MFCGRKHAIAFSRTGMSALHRRHLRHLSCLMNRSASRDDVTTMSIWHALFGNAFAIFSFFSYRECNFFRALVENARNKREFQESRYSPRIHLIIFWLTVLHGRKVKKGIWEFFRKFEKQFLRYFFFSQKTRIIKCLKICTNNHKYIQII